MIDRVIGITGIALAIVIGLLQYYFPQLPSWVPVLGFAIAIFLVGLCIGLMAAGGRFEMIDKFTETLSILLKGKIPKPINLGKIIDKRERDLANMLNQLITFMQEIHNFIIPLSKGELTETGISPKNFFGSPFKELHSRLLHLTWQANQVAKGDFSQRVDFMGDFSESFNHMIDSLKHHEEALRNKIDELKKALSHIDILEGILPICSYCKRIRLEGTDPEDQINWIQVERYISEKTESQFLHSICPECMKKHYPDD